MSDQAVIDLYINDLASTTHQLYQEKAANQDLVQSNARLNSDNATLSGENATLRQEISALQSKYDALKGQAGSIATEVVPGELVEHSPEVPSSPRG